MPCSAIPTAPLARRSQLDRRRRPADAGRYRAAGRARRDAARRCRSAALDRARSAPTADGRGAASRSTASPASCAPCTPKRATSAATSPPAPPIGDRRASTGLDEIARDDRHDDRRASTTPRRGSPAATQRGGGAAQRARRGARTMRATRSADRPGQPPRLRGGVRGAPAGAPWCLALCDIDQFKRINDEYGHARRRPRAERGRRRRSPTTCEGHIVARHGGEEFGVLLTARRRWSTPARSSSARAADRGQALPRSARRDAAARAGSPSRPAWPRSRRARR